MVGVWVRQYDGVQMIDSAITQIRDHRAQTDMGRVRVVIAVRAAPVDQHRMMRRRFHENAVALPHIDHRHTQLAGVGIGGAGGKDTG